MLRTKVILLNVTNLSDARYAAGMGVNFIGFSINPVSNHFVTAKDANAISEWLSGVSLIGNIGSTIPAFEEYKLDYLLTDNPDLIEELDEPIVSLALTIENVESVHKTLAAFTGSTSFFILKVNKEEIDQLLPELKRLNSNFSCYISSEFDKNNIEKVIDTAPEGIVLYGSYEEKPGLSNYDGIADVLELLDEA